MVTNDYQQVQKDFTLAKATLFLWPTEHEDFDFMNIVLSSVLALPVVLTSGYE